MDYKLLFKTFCDWIKDVEEDDPLPFECKVICFGLTKKGEIFFSGSEFVPKIVEPCDFFPLEAQCFDFTKTIDFLTFENLVKDFNLIKKNFFDAVIVCYEKQFCKPIII